VATQIQDIEGEKLPDGEFHVERWMAFLWADATDNDDDVFRYKDVAMERTEAGSQLVPPEYAINIAWAGCVNPVEAEPLDIDIGEDTTFHVSQSFEFHQLLEVGETYEVQGTIETVEQKTGDALGEFHLATIEYEAVDASGQPAFSTTSKLIFKRGDDG
jgi:hypothetical protein